LTTTAAVGLKDHFSFSFDFIRRHDQPPTTKQQQVGQLCCTRPTSKKTAPFVTIAVVAFPAPR
jgi:hypothetical protein